MTIRWQRRTRFAAVSLACILLAAVFRLPGLEDFPPGLWFDEGLAGQNAWSVVEGERPLFFYADGYPEEPLYFYLVASRVALSGDATPRIRPLRETAALSSLVAIPLFLGWAACLMPWNWAVAATVCFSLLPWTTHFARLGFRVNLAPVVVCAIAWPLTSWIKKPQGRWHVAAISGVSLGLAPYTYTASWGLIPMVAVLLATVVALGRHETPEKRRGWLQGIAMGIAAAVIVSAPILIHVLSHGNAMNRVQGVGPGAEGYSFGRNLLGLLCFPGLAGDPVFKHGPPYRPLFPLTGALVFVAGALLILVHPRRRGTSWIVVPFLMAAFIAASLFSFQAPNKLRMLGAAPGAVLVVFLGMRALAVGLRRQGVTKFVVRVAVGSALLVYFLGEVGPHYYDWKNSPRRRSEFSAPFTDVARWVTGTMPKERCGTLGPRQLGVPMLAPASVKNHASVRFLTRNLPPGPQPIGVENLMTELVRLRDRGASACYLLVTRGGDETARGKTGTSHFELLAKSGLWSTEAPSVEIQGNGREVWATIVPLDLSRWDDSRVAALAPYFTGY